jgi:hypothetical protein
VMVDGGVVIYRFRLVIQLNPLAGVETDC